MLLHCSHCVKADVFWCEIGIEKESWGWTRLKRSGGSEGGGGGIFIYCLFVEMQEEWGGGDWEMEEVVVVKGKRQEGGMKA